MKKLYQYITKSFFGTFVLTFFIVVFIWVMQFVWLYVDDLVGKGLEIKIIAELLFYTSITAIPMSLPLALLPLAGALVAVFLPFFLSRVAGVRLLI